MARPERPETLGGMPEDEEMMMGEDMGGMPPEEGGGEVDAIASEVTQIVTPGVEQLIRDAIAQVLGGGAPMEGGAPEEEMI